MKSLSDYLNIEDTVKLIKEFTKVPFFNENNLFDLVVKEEMIPIVYFDGFGSTWVNKKYSIYKEDFGESGAEWFNNNDISYSSQSNSVMGYFYATFAAKIMNSKVPIEHRRFVIQNLIAYQVYSDTSLPNQGLNSKGAVFKETTLNPNDPISLSLEHPKDGIQPPSFSRSDIKFFISDIIKMLEKNGYYSTEDTENSNPVNNKEANPKDSAYHLIAVIKDLLLDPNINAYHFKTDINNSTNQPTQAGLTEYIDSLNIEGLKSRNINGIFSQANRLLKDAKKK